LTEKSAGSSFTGSLPCGRPARLLDPEAAAVEAVEFAVLVDFPGLLSFAAEAFSAIVLAPHAPATARLIASASAATPRIRGLARFPSIVPPLGSLPFAVVRARRFTLPFHVRWFLYHPLSQTFVYVKTESSIASEREDRLSARCEED
jgi:hypothetical protein